MFTLKKTVSWAGIVLLFFFVTQRTFFFKKGFLENLSTTIAYPALRISSFISEHAKKIARKKKTYHELYTTHTLLQNDFDALFQEVIMLRATIRHHNLTHELENFRQRYKLDNAHLCKILVKNLVEDEHYFLVNQGSRDGILKNMVAIYKLQILGKVTAVYPCYSKITLITDRSCKIASFTNTTNAKGIAEGGNTINSVKLRYVNRLEQIIKNDLVFSSGQGLVFPEGFCLGKISAHAHNKKELYHTVTIAPIVDFQTITYCLLTNRSKINLF